MISTTVYKFLYPSSCVLLFQNSFVHSSCVIVTHLAAGLSWNFEWCLESPALLCGQDGAWPFGALVFLAFISPLPSTRAASSLLILTLHWPRSTETKQSALMSPRGFHRDDKTHYTCAQSRAKKEWNVRSPKFRPKPSHHSCAQIWVNALSKVLHGH